MYHHYRGDPLEVLLLYPDGTGQVQVVGTDLAAGQRPQLFIPVGTFHISRLRPGSAWALLGTSEWPGVEPADVEMGDAATLMAAYPALREEIARFTGGSQQPADPAGPGVGPPPLPPSGNREGA